MSCGYGWLRAYRTFTVLYMYGYIFSSQVHSCAAIDDEFKREIPSLLNKSQNLQKTIQEYQPLPADPLKPNVKDRFVDLMTPFAEMAVSQANVRC